MPFNRFQEFDRLTAVEKDFIEKLSASPHRVPRLGRIQEQGVSQSYIFFLISGWVTSTVMLPNGGQQIVKLHLTGDILGTPSLSLRKTADALTALTDVVVAKFPVSTIGLVFSTMPHLASLMFLGAQRERIALMDALTAMGRTPAVSRLAAFVLDIYHRVTLAGLSHGSSFMLPLSQQQIGDLAGISAVHVNRSIRQLRESGFLVWDKQVVTIRNQDGLERVAIRAERTVNHAPQWLPRLPTAGAD